MILHFQVWFSWVWKFSFVARVSSVFSFLYMVEVTNLCFRTGRDLSLDTMWVCMFALDEIDN